jgi:sterol desaturase/sphingolipid hydroxylase (fatty acid hydroxylase superfamily)
MPFLRSNLWDGRKHYLDRMTMRDLVRAYFAYPAIQAYLALGAAASAVAVYLWPGIGAALASVAATLMIYGLVWYVLHRFVLHGRYLFKSAMTAPVWKRIHFDHHGDPNDLGVLFGALYTTLPTIAIATMPIGWAIGGPGGAAAAFAAGLFTTCAYEFCHCIQHLSFNPRRPWLKRIKRLHMAHHFHSEQGNYGITTFFWDKLFGSYYGRIAEKPASPTVRNLGYTEAQYRQYPWVAELSGLKPAETDTKRD